MKDGRERLDVARTFAKLTTTAAGREYLARNGCVSRTPVIAVLYDDQVGDVMRRVDRHIQHGGAQKCVIAMIHAGELEIITATPSKDRAAMQDVSRYACIGMLIEAVKRNKSWECFRLTDTRLAAPRVSFGGDMKVPALT